MVSSFKRRFHGTSSFDKVYEQLCFCFSACCGTVDAMTGPNAPLNAFQGSWLVDACPLLVQSKSPETRWPWRRQTQRHFTKYLMNGSVLFRSASCGSGIESGQIDQGMAICLTARVVLCGNDSKNIEFTSA